MARQQLTYEEVLEAAGQLTAAERRRLVEELKHPVSGEGYGGSRDPRQLLGLGANIWRDPETGELVDAQEYVNQERASWDE